MIIVCITQFYQMHINFGFDKDNNQLLYQLTGFEPFTHITDLSPDHRATPTSVQTENQTL